MGCNCDRPPGSLTSTQTAAADRPAREADESPPATRLPGAPEWRPGAMEARPDFPTSVRAVQFPDRNVDGLYPDRLVERVRRASQPVGPGIGWPGAGSVPASDPVEEPSTIRRVAEPQQARKPPAAGEEPREPRRGSLSRLLGRLARQPSRPSRPALPEFSIIIPNKDEGERLLQTVRSVLDSQGPSFEVIVVDDRSRRPPDLHGRWPNVTQLDGPGLGVAPARNLGASRARGRYLVFVDAHVWVPPDWLAHIERAFRADPTLAAVSPGIAAEGDVGTVGWGLTWDERLNIRWLPRPESAVAEVPLLPGGCVAVRKEVFDSSGGFNRGFRGHGYDDQEFSLRLWLLGHRLACLRDLTVVHHFRTEFPYPVEPWHHYYNQLRMAVSHFNEERVGKVLSLLRDVVDPSLLLARLFTDDTLEDRRRWLEIRAHDDDWFMRRFGIPF